VGRGKRGVTGGQSITNLVSVGAPYQKIALVVSGAGVAVHANYNGLNHPVFQRSRGGVVPDIVPPALGTGGSYLYAMPWRGQSLCIRSSLELYYISGWRNCRI
jgi:hypothetical protein